MATQENTKNFDDLLNDFLKLPLEEQIAILNHADALNEHPPSEFIDSESTPCKNTVPEPANPLVGGDLSDTIDKAICVISFLNDATETDCALNNDAVTGLHYITHMIESALRYEAGRLEARS